MPLVESAASGDRLSALQDLRDILARQIEACESMRDAAALAGRFQAVLAEIAELTPAKPEGDALDEIAARRAARRAVPPAGKPRAKRSG